MTGTDDLANGAPVGEIVQVGFQIDLESTAAMFVEMKTVFGYAPGETRGQRGGTGFEIGARAEYRIGVDHRAGITPGDMFAEVRLVQRLIIDAGVGSNDIHAPQAGDQLFFLERFFRILLQAFDMGKVDTARIGRCRLPAFRAGLRSPFEKGLAGVAHDFDITHHVHIRHRHEAFRAEELADFQLQLQRFLHCAALLAAQHFFLLCRQSHRENITNCFYLLFLTSGSAFGGFLFRCLFRRAEALLKVRPGHRAVHRHADDALRQILDRQENDVLVLGRRNQVVRRIRRDINQGAGRGDNAFAVDRPHQRALQNIVQLLVLVRVHPRAGAAWLVDVADEYA